MKAIYFEKHGENDVLRYGDVPDPPPPGPGEVAVEVRAAALNHLDIFVRRGWRGLSLAMPHVGGADAAGVVAELGEGVQGWQVGERVAIDPGIQTTEDEWTRTGRHAMSPGYQLLGEHRAGTLAERVVVPSRNLHRIPDNIAFTDAAAPLLVGVTAWHMLIVAAGLRAGESVLFVGAGGGVNSMAIQIARLAGATVIALTSGAAKMEQALALGADHVIDYTEDPRWERRVFTLTDKRGVDIVVDNVGQATIQQSIKAVARGGRVVTVGNTSGAMVQIDIRYLFVKQFAWIGATMGSPDEFRAMLAQVWAGRLRPVIDRVMPLSEGIEAVRIMERGEQFGKLVFTV